MELRTKRQKFLDKIEVIYQEHSGRIVDSLSGIKHKSFRVINLKDQDEVLVDLINEGFEVINSQIPNAFLVNNNESLKLSESSVYKNKKIYIQDISSMLPVIELNPQNEEKILDLCASPGSKTNQIWNTMNGNAEITAVEIDRKRFFILNENLKSYGIGNVNLVNADGTRLADRKPEFLNYFDKILVDAPCSSEGLITLEKDENLKYWNPKKWKNFTGTQKNLLASAFSMLKPGGTLVYSTCTMSIEENEEVVDWALSRFNNIELSNFESEIINKIDSKIEGIVIEKLSEEVQKTVRIIPNKEFSAFFMAKFRKLV